MMSLLLGDGADCLYKFERADEIREVVALLDMMFFDDFPSTHLAREIGKFCAP